MRSLKQPLERLLFSYQPAFEDPPAARQHLAGCAILKGPTMEWAYVSYFLGGCFLCNAIPHFVSGVMGRPFQSPFAKPPGKGLSSSTVNVLWGFVNFVVSYVLICRVSDFHLRSTTHVAFLGLGFVLMGLISARLFGRSNGGNSPADSAGPFSG